MGFGIGRITYFMCIDYCKANEIEGDQRDDFVEIILEMDQAYLDHCESQKPKKKDKGGEYG